MLLPVLALAVVLMASKTWNGHAEAAAGLVATLHAHQAILHTAALPLLHLRHLNPYVASALEAGEDEASAPRLRAGRQPSAGGSILPSCGISAFAFQVLSALEPRVVSQPAVTSQLVPVIVWILCLHKLKSGR